MNPATLHPPRWTNGPQICATANLPAFETQGGMKAFHAANGPSCGVLREWLCEDCGGWHEETSAPDPCGASSGTGRSAKTAEAEKRKFEEIKKNL